MTYKVIEGCHRKVAGHSFCFDQSQNWLLPTAPPSRQLCPWSQMDYMWTSFMPTQRLINSFLVKVSGYGRLSVRLVYKSHRKVRKNKHLCTGQTNAIFFAIGHSNALRYLLFYFLFFLGQNKSRKKFSILWLQKSLIKIFYWPIYWYFMKWWHLEVMA